VEDDSPNFLYFKSLLKKTGCKIIWKKNGQEALEWIQDSDSEFDLVIMDILIPFISGIELTREIRKNNKSVPVIVVTAYISKEIKEKSFLAGCNEFMVKPVLPDHLLDVLATYLRDTEKSYTFQWAKS